MSTSWWLKRNMDTIWSRYSRPKIKHFSLFTACLCLSLSSDTVTFPGCLTLFSCPLFLQALGMLLWHKHDVERSLADLANFTPFPDEWTVEDKVLFEQAFSFHGKSFHRIQQMVRDWGKNMHTLLVQNFQKHFQYLILKCIDFGVCSFQTSWYPAWWSTTTAGRRPGPGPLSWTDRQGGWSAKERKMTGMRFHETLIILGENWAWVEGRAEGRMDGAGRTQTTHLRSGIYKIPLLNDTW